jgi:hypothetical protein
LVLTINTFKNIAVWIQGRNRSHQIISLVPAGTFQNSRTVILFSNGSRTFTTGWSGAEMITLYYIWDQIIFIISSISM